MDDLELLAEYARSRSHEVFARVADRYVDLIYSAALRQTRDPHVAQDVTQAVLIILMNKSGSLPAGTIVPAWLLTVTRYAAIDAIKMEARRKKREQRVATMNSEARTDPEAPQWEELSPLLDAALLKLRMEDRDAVVLRYLLGKSPEEIAWVMGVTEEAARKRVSRALHRLRKIFAREGIRAGEAALGTVIATHSVQAAPAAVRTIAHAISLPASGALSTPPTVLARGAMKSLWWASHGKLVASAVVLLMLGVGATLIFRNRPKPTPIVTPNPEAVVPPTPAPSPTPAPTPSPTPVQNVATYDPTVYQSIPRTITRLILASNRNDLPAVRAFLAAGDDPNAVSSDGNDTTALMYALTHGGDASYESVRLLLDAAADVNVRSNDLGYTPLLRAVHYRSPRVAQLLLDHGADITAKTSQGDDALSLATKAGDAAMIDLIQKSRQK